MRRSDPLRFPFAEFLVATGIAFVIAAIAQAWRRK